MALVHGAQEPLGVRDGLVLYLDAANARSYPRSGTTWFDRSGNANNATLINGVEYSGSNFGTLTFDTTNEYVTVPSVTFSPGTSAFTWNFWCKLNDLTTFSILFSGQGSNHPEYGVIFMDPRSGQAGLGYYANAGRIQDNNTSFGSNWWYISFVGSGGADGARNLKLYRNAVQAGSTYNHNYNLGGFSPVCIFGANHDSFSERMRGNISNVSYYNRALSATEIAQNYNALKSRYINLPVPSIVTSGLQMYLDAGNLASYNPSTSGNTWTDLSGNGNTGTLEGGVGYSSANGGSLTFDGTDDYVNTTFATTSGQAVTYCGWLYSTETTSIYKNFVDSGSTLPMIWWNTSGQIEFDTGGSYTTPAVYRNQWVYVALSKPSGSSSASYYVNGVLVGSGGAYTTPALTPSWFNRGGGQTWKGNCSVIQAYNRALTAPEIAQNYNALKSRYI